MKKFLFTGLTATLFACYSCTSVPSRLTDSSVDLTACTHPEILKIDDFKGTPDKNGILRSYAVILPKFDELIYFGSDGNNKSGIIPSNRCHLWVLDDACNIQNQAEVKKQAGSFHGTATQEGTFTILRLTNGKYMAILPLVGNIRWDIFNLQPAKSRNSILPHSARKRSRPRCRSWRLPWPTISTRRLTTYGTPS